MAPRLNKRQQRELEEQEQLERLRDAHNEQGEAAGDESDEAPGPVASVFATLDQDEPDQEASDSDPAAVTKTTGSKSKKKKKNKKKPVVAASEPLDSRPNTAPPSVKKSKPKPTVKPVEQDDGLDEIDRALAELGMSPHVPTVAPIKLDSRWAAVRDLFVIDPKHLDPEAELRRFFGSKVINATPIAAPRSGHHARFANNIHHKTSIRRTASYLATPEAGWHPLAANGITLERSPEQSGGTGEMWSYRHSVDYKESQLLLLEVLQQADGNKLFNVLEKNPYSVDTLMQLSEMSAQQGDLGASSTYLSKALYALSGPLPPSFLTGSLRLDYAQVENRAFFLAVARKVALLVKRGTWRTACEWTKIGLGVGGSDDPVGMLLFIDFLAPKARQDLWFLAFVETLPSVYPSSQIASYPGLLYAKALCLRNMEEDKNENDDKSSAALRDAILTFPMVTSLLYASLGGDIPPALLSNRRSQVDGRFSTNPSYVLSLLSEFYVARSSPIWKEPSCLAWLHKTAKEVAGSMDDSTSPHVQLGEKLWSVGAFEAGTVPIGIIRAAYISEIPSLRPYLPPSLSGTSYSYDPIPPPRSANTTFYDDTYFQPLYEARASHRVNPNSARAQRQSAAQMQQMQAALRQFEVMLGMGTEVPPVDLNPELREELMREYEQMRVMLAQGQGQDVPGGFPGGDEDEDEYETDEEDQLEGPPGGFMNMLAGMMRRGG